MVFNPNIPDWQFCYALLPAGYASRSELEKMNGYEYILSKQIAWATNYGITLVGSKGKLRPQGRHLQHLFTRLPVGSLSLRPAALPIGNLQPLITQTLLP